MTSDNLLFSKVFWCIISSWHFPHKCDITKLIYVIIHEEKAFQALHCKVCGNYFKKRKRIAESGNFSFLFLWFSVKDIKISDVFYKIQNFLVTSWVSKIKFEEIQLFLWVLSHLTISTNMILSVYCLSPLSVVSTRVVTLFKLFRKN